MSNTVLNDLFGIEDFEPVDSSDCIHKGRTYKKIYLEYRGSLPTKCPVCDNNLKKHGKRDVEALDTPFTGVPIVLNFKFPRLRCPECKYLWQPEIKNVDHKRRLTTRAFISIAERGLRYTFNDICNEYVLSNNTARNIFIDYIKTHEKMLRFKTPAFLGLDEKKIKKLGELTVITDLEHKTIFDILKERNQRTLTEYFMNLQDRDKVLWVCTDMYRPFRRSIGEAFPNARWVIDKFHVTAKANEAVDHVRRTLQESMSRRQRISSKKGLAYTLKTRYRDLTIEEAATIASLRTHNSLFPLAIAYDLKEAFFNIYDENPTSKDNALQAFEEWKLSIPEDELYVKFRELVGTVNNFKEEIFNYWDCPIAITNGFTECSNRIIAEKNTIGRGTSFDILRARTLYRRTNLANAIEGGTLIGPPIGDEPIFRYDIIRNYETNYDGDNSELKIDEDTGEVIEEFWGDENEE